MAQHVLNEDASIDEVITGLAVKHQIVMHRLEMLVELHNGGEGRLRMAKVAAMRRCG